MLKTRYIFIRFVKLFFLVSISFVSLFVFIQLLEDMLDKLRYGEHLNIPAYIYGIPAVFLEIAPVITFLSAMFLIGEMMKWGEIRILEISGVKPGKILFILFFCGLLSSALSFYLKNFTVPACENRVHGFQTTQINFSSPEHFFYSSEYTDDGIFRDIQLSTASSDNRILTVKAKSGLYKGDGIWQFRDGNLWFIDSNNNIEDTMKFSETTVEINLHPRILLSLRNMEQLSLPELRNIMKLMENFNMLSARIESHYHERFAYPLLNLFLLFIAVPCFDFRNSLSRFFIISAAILVSFFCYTLYSLGAGIASTGQVPVHAGAWMVHYIIILGLIPHFIKLKKEIKSFII